MRDTKEQAKPRLKDLPPEFSGLKVGVVVKGTGMCQSCQLATTTEN